MDMSLSKLWETVKDRETWHATAQGIANRHDWVSKEKGMGWWRAKGKWSQLLLLLLSRFSHVRLCDPRDGSPPGSPIPGILQARTLEWVAISFSNAWKWKVKVKSLSHVRLSVTPWTAVYQAPLSMGFSRQEYWSGVPLPSPKWSLDLLKIPGASDTDC